MKWYYKKHKSLGRALGAPLYICFINFKRAFDCINRMLFFAKLNRHGLSGKPVIVFGMYKRIKCILEYT